MSVEDRAAIEHLIREYVALSAGMRFQEKRAYWDPEEPSPVLAPEEAPRTLVGWEAIERYWGGSRETIADLRTECFDVHVNLLGPDLAAAIFRQHWTATMSGPRYLGGAPLAATVRATWLLRRRAAGWRIFAVVEAHVDGAEYFADLYRRRAAERRLAG
jgi:ketosteroid isomerase-like protein